MGRRISSGVFLGLVFVCGRAWAADGVDAYGRAGVINIGADLSLYVQSQMYSAPSGHVAPATETSYSIGPSLDVFVVDNFSVGAQPYVREAHEVDAKFNTIGIAARVGYYVPVAQRVGLWPQLKVGYDADSAHYTGVLGTVDKDVTFKTLLVGMFMPLLIQPAEHFQIGIGPFIDAVVWAKAASNDAIKATTLGLQVRIGGWWKP